MAEMPVILVVEDDWLVRETIVQALRDAGWVVCEAGSGEGAIALLQTIAGPVDALFTDIQLSGYLSGWDVAEAVRQAHPGASIMYTSGNSIDRRRQVSNSTFFQKPYLFSEIVAACRRSKA